MKALYISLFLIGGYFIFQSFNTTDMAITEKQAYRLVKKEDGFEIRFYPSATMATVYSKGTNYKSVANSGFNKLAKFIFGGNQQRESIPMTAPVIMSFTNKGSSMSFVMPKKYEGKQLPTPNDSTRSPPFTPVFPQKSQNLAQTWPEITPNKKGLCL